MKALMYLYIPTGPGGRIYTLILAEVEARGSYNVKVLRIVYQGVDDVSADDAGGMFYPISADHVMTEEAAFRRALVGVFSHGLAKGFKEWLP